MEVLKGVTWLGSGNILLEAFFDAMVTIVVILSILMKDL